MIWISERKTSPDNSSCTLVTTVSLVAVHKQLTQKKNGKGMSQKMLVSVHECFCSSSTVPSRATSLLLGVVGRCLVPRGSLQQLLGFFFPRSSCFEKDNRKITAVCARCYMETSKT